MSPHGKDLADVVNVRSWDGEILLHSEWAPSPVSLKEGGTGKLTAEEKALRRWRQTLQCFALKMKEEATEAKEYMQTQEIEK